MINSKDKLFIDIALRIAEESTCASVNVGAVIVRDGRIISMGYNGVPAGFDHCNDKFTEEYKENNANWRDIHHEWSDMNEIHAELNAILFAARSGISIDGATIYSTHMPCHQCLKNIAQSGLKRVVYKYKYDKGIYDYPFLSQLDSVSKLSIECIEEEK